MKEAVRTGRNPSAACAHGAAALLDHAREYAPEHDEVTEQVEARLEHAQARRCPRTPAYCRGTTDHDHGVVA